MASSVVTKKASRPSIVGFPCEDCGIVRIVNRHWDTSGRVGASPGPFDTTWDSYDGGDFLLSGSRLGEFYSEG